jgi:hypothetical protein
MHERASENSIERVAHACTFFQLANPDEDWTIASLDLITLGFPTDFLS